MLFIDEAYALRAEGSSDSAGQEGVNTLVKESEDHTNDLVIILAGYNKEMASFVSSNSGLASRFPNVFNFADYSHEEMAGILRSVAVEKVTRATLPKSASCRRAHPAALFLSSAAPSSTTSPLRLPLPPHLDLDPLP